MGVYVLYPSNASLEIFNAKNQQNIILHLEHGNIKLVLILKTTFRQFPPAEKTVMVIV